MYSGIMTLASWLCGRPRGRAIHDVTAIGPAAGLRNTFENQRGQAYSASWGHYAEPCNVPPFWSSAPTLNMLAVSLETVWVEWDRNRSLSFCQFLLHCRFVHDERHVTLTANLLLAATSIHRSLARP